MLESLRVTSKNRFLAAHHSESKCCSILGIRFFVGSAQEAVELGLRGGLVAVPAAPALANIEREKGYRDALLHADLVITDSGLMVLWWRCLTRERITRLSGLEYLRVMLATPVMREPGAVFWVMPNESGRDQNLAWLSKQGFEFTTDDCYVAPTYSNGEITDAALIEIIVQRRPKHIVICLGGGTQERLGLMLKRTLDYRVGIHCIGAAIAFLSGEQVRIPNWADFFFLGWFLRCLSEPTKFVPRYWRARRLIPLMWRYRRELPPLVEVVAEQQ